MVTKIEYLTEDRSEKNEQNQYQYITIQVFWFEVEFVKTRKKAKLNIDIKLHYLQIVTGLWHLTIFSISILPGLCFYEIECDFADNKTTIFSVSKIIRINRTITEMGEIRTNLFYGEWFYVFFMYFYI